MNSLPVELMQQITHFIRASIASPLRTSDARSSARAAQEFNKLMLALSLVSRGWTGIAQVELFRDFILSSERKAGLFFALLEARAEFREYAVNTKSIRLGNDRALSFRRPGSLKASIDGITKNCPNLVEVHCTMVETCLSNFGM